VVWALVAGPIAGVASIGYVRTVAWADRRKPRGRLRLVVPVVSLGLLGAVSIPFPQVLGNGKDIAQLAFAGQVAPALLLKLLLCSSQQSPCCVWVAARRVACSPLRSRWAPCWEGCLTMPVRHEHGGEYTPFLSAKRVMIMKTGWCAPLREAELLHRLGFDFIELPLAAFVFEDRTSFESAKKALNAAALPASAFNVFFPRGLRVVGEEVDGVRIRTYIDRATDFLHNAQAKVAVLGSAAARNVPEGFDRTRAEDQFLQVLSWCADAIEGTGITLAVEPLNRKESNLINSVAEAVSFAERINRPQIRVLADFYHMDEENEPLETLLKYGRWLAHVHLADTGRRNPGSGLYDYDRFTRLLKEIGYTGAVSAECNLKDTESEMRRSLTFLRRFW